MNPLTRYRGQQDTARQVVPLTSRHPAGFAARLLVCVALTTPVLSVRAEPAPVGATTAPDAAEVQALRQELARQDALLQKLMSQQSDLSSRQAQPAGSDAAAHAGPAPGVGRSAPAAVSPPPASGVTKPQAGAEALPLTAATVTPPPVAQPPVAGSAAGGAAAPDAVAQAPSPAGAVGSGMTTPAPAATAASAPVPSAGQVALQDENARRAYASGVSLAYEMQQSLAVQKSLGISLPPETLMAGLQDALSNRPLQMPDRDIQSTLASLNADFTARMQSRRADEVARGREFRADFRRKKGVVSDAGSLYLIETRGTGRLRTSDMATLLVTGRLPDGTVFDGSGEAGQARKVKVGAMLPAIAIGLQKVGAGGHLTVVVPPEKGYGDMGLPPTVPGGATLIFDITVKGVNDAG